MEGTFLDAGVMDIVWFLLKVIFALLILFAAFSLLFAMAGNDTGWAIITYLIIVPLFLYGSYALLSWVLHFFIGGKLASHYAIIGIVGFLVLAVIGWAVELIEKHREKVRNEEVINQRMVDKIANKVKRGEILSEDEYDNLPADPKKALEILEMNQKNIERGDKRFPLSVRTEEESDNLGVGTKP